MARAPGRQEQQMGTYTLTADQSKLVEQMAPLVKRIAYHFMARLPASVHVDDLIQAGLMGLLDAARNFDDTQGAQFETYAIQRIRGSILDELRQADWLPRNVRKNLRRIEGTISALEQRLGRAPREQELAEALGVPIDEYQHMLLESRGYQLLHYEDFQSRRTATSSTCSRRRTRSVPWRCWRTSASAARWCRPSVCCPSAKRSSWVCTTSRR
jgi:FliA/WhiG family RNA polymerase sigma factor